jgi:hypothetical protein
MPIDRLTHLALTSLVFEETGSPEDLDSRLLTTIKIGGTCFHLEAIAVDIDVNGAQCAADFTFEDMLRGLNVAFSPDGEFQTVHINEREYALFMSPFGR